MSLAARDDLQQPARAARKNRHARRRRRRTSVRARCARTHTAYARKNVAWAGPNSGSSVPGQHFTWACVHARLQPGSSAACHARPRVGMLGCLDACAGPLARSHTCELAHQRAPCRMCLLACTPHTSHTQDACARARAAHIPRTCARASSRMHAHTRCILETSMPQPTDWPTLNTTIT